MKHHHYRKPDPIRAAAARAMILIIGEVAGGGPIEIAVEELNALGFNEAEITEMIKANVSTKRFEAWNDARAESETTPEDAPTSGEDRIAQQAGA